MTVNHCIAKMTFEYMTWDPGAEEKPPILLVHGFGASAYHWRYAIPELAKHYCVHAIDLLGFGYSSKPSVEYNGYTIWSEQLNDYVKQVS